MILIASTTKALLRTEKQTIRRGATLAQYDEEINELYSTRSAVLPTPNIHPAAWTPDDWLGFVRSAVHHFLPLVSSDEQDLFSMGCTR